MTYAERLYFTTEPVAHCVAFYERLRLRAIDRRLRASVRAAAAGRTPRT